MVIVLLIKIKKKRFKCRKAKEGVKFSYHLFLLSGDVAANNNNYVYYDGTKGDLDNVLVNVGIKLAGQAQFNTRVLKHKLHMMLLFVL